MDQSTTLRIQMNSAEYAAQQARAAYIASLPVPDQANFFVTDAQPKMDAASREGRQLEATGHFVLGLLARETGSAGSLDTVHAMTEQEVGDMEAEIERLKQQIRMERRAFLDAQPSVSPAVAGLYFTKVPDNQVLIGLLSAVAALLTFLTVGIFLGLLPIYYLTALGTRERVYVIVGLWAATILMGYLGLYSFT